MHVSRHVSGLVSEKHALLARVEGLQDEAAALAAQTASLGRAVRAAGGLAAAPDRAGVHTLEGEARRREGGRETDSGVKDPRVQRRVRMRIEMLLEGNGGSICPRLRLLQNLRLYERTQVAVEKIPFP